MIFPPARAPSAPFCLCPDGIRVWSDLLADAARLRASLPGHDAVCNMMAGRYDFAAMLLAAMAEGLPTILPSARAEHAVAAALDGCRRPLIADRPEQLDRSRAGAPVGDLTGEVRVFTSGSTGTPLRHVKDWPVLAAGGGLAARLAARAGLMPGRSLIIGTTPHQHMFGLEAVILAGLAHGHAVCDETPFYPADLEAAVDRAGAAGFAQVCLVSSPSHLRFLVEAVRSLPQIRCVISATAPLHRDLATRLEDGRRVVFEIYGSTETGSLAWRHPASSELWTPLEGFSLMRRGEAWEASSQHLQPPVPLPDEIAPGPDGRFRLLGRRGDMIRIAGKRQSLGALNAALSALTGIGDAVIVREANAGEDRLCVLVVPAPGAGPDEGALARLVRDHLLRHVDPVFVPRTVRVVAALPRNATGKILTRELAQIERAPADERLRQAEPVTARPFPAPGH